MRSLVLLQSARSPKSFLADVTRKRSETGMSLLVTCERVQTVETFVASVTLVDVVLVNAEVTRQETRGRKGLVTCLAMMDSWCF